jgi:hypothetical protein
MNDVYLVPPMDEEPPRDFVDFVYVHLGDLQREAARLTGGPQHADEVYPDALADVAGHWRRLRLRRRLTHRDAAGEFLSRRLAKRAAQWREDQIYEVEVQLLRAPVYHHQQSTSIALRKATVLPSTFRRQARPVAEASIAWTHAWRRAYWRRVARVAVAAVLIFIGTLQAVPVLPN